MNATASTLGIWRLGETFSSSADFEWRRAERDGAAELVAKIAKSPEAATALAVEARRVAALRDLAPEALAPVVDASPGAIVYARARGGPLAAASPLDDGRALALGASLARLVRALTTLGLSHSLDSVLYDPASARVALTGLSRLEPSAGTDPRLLVVAWGELMAGALGAPRSPRGYLLERLSARRVRPSLVALVRDALRGDESAIERATSGPRPSPREKAARGLRATIAGPLAYHVIDGEEHGDGTATLAALCARTGSLVTIRTAGKGDARAARARVEEEFGRARSEPAPLRVPLLRFRAAAIDPERARAPSPELRRDEAYAVYAWGEPAKVPVLSAPLALARFEAERAGQKARLTVDPGSAKRVLVVSGEGPLLVPEDGVRLLDLEGDALRAAHDVPLAARYAAFPLGDEAGVPSFASLVAKTDELARFEGEPGVGKVAFSWSPQSAVIVRVSEESEPSSPLEGRLAYWGKKQARIEIPATSGKTLFARAFVWREDGTFSRGVAARADSWRAPEPVSALAADASRERVVALSWRWPRERSRIQRAFLRRDPPFPEVTLDPSGPASYEDRAPPLGTIARYELVVVSGGVEARADATALAWAELASLRAEGAGEAIALSWSLPEGALGAARVVRRLDRAPADLDDGEEVPVSGSEHLDGPFPPGTQVHYRAGLVFASGQERSPGLTASARALEKAGALADLVVVPKKKALEVRWKEPSSGIEDAVLYAGPDGREKRPYDRAAFLAGRPVRIEGAGPQRVRVVPRWKGREDPSGSVSAVAQAWDELESVSARPGPGSVELSWSAPPAGALVVVKRRLDVKDAPWEELAVLGAETTRFRDEPPRGKGCVFKVALRFRSGGETVESDGIERREQARELPPELGSPAPRARSAPGQLAVVYFEPKAKINYTGVVVYESSRTPAELQESLKKLGREHHGAEDLPALGLVEVAQKDKNPAPRVEVAIDVREPAPRAATLVVATRNGPVRRVNAVLRAMKLPAGALAVRGAIDEKTGKPRLEWTLPAGGAKLARLELRRALDDPDPEIPAKDREALEAPFVQPLAENATSHLDATAEDGVTFAFTLAATFEEGPERFEVLSPPAALRGGKPGGKLLLQAAQARGVFGFKKPLTVELSVSREGGAGAWPSFQVVRTLEGSKGEVVVASFDGGERAPGPMKDEDLTAFTPGMTVGYALKVPRYLDARRVTIGAPARLKLG